MTHFTFIKNSSLKYFHKFIYITYIRYNIILSNAVGSGTI